MKYAASMRVVAPMQLRCALVASAFRLRVLPFKNTLLRNYRAFLTLRLRSFGGAIATQINLHMPHWHRQQLQFFRRVIQMVLGPRVNVAASARNNHKSAVRMLLVPAPLPAQSARAGLLKAQHRRLIDAMVQLSRVNTQSLDKLGARSELIAVSKIIRNVSNATRTVLVPAQRSLKGVRVEPHQARNRQRADAAKVIGHVTSLSNGQRADADRAINFIENQSNRRRRVGLAVFRYAGDARSLSAIRQASPNWRQGKQVIFMHAQSIANPFRAEQLDLGRTRDAVPHVAGDFLSVPMVTLKTRPDATIFSRIIRSLNLARSSVFTHVQSLAQPVRAEHVRARKLGSVIDVLSNTKTLFLDRLHSRITAITNSMIVRRLSIPSSMRRAAAHPASSGFGVEPAQASGRKPGAANSLIRHWRRVSAEQFKARQDFASDASATPKQRIQNLMTRHFISVSSAPNTASVAPNQAVLPMQRALLKSVQAQKQSEHNTVRSTATTNNRNLLHRYGHATNFTHFVRELATNAPAQGRLQQTLTRQMEQRLRQVARENEQKLQTQMVQQINQGGETREQLRKLMSESILAPKLLQTLTDRLYHALEKRAAVERYRKGTY